MSLWSAEHVRWVQSTFTGIYCFKNKTLLTFVFPLYFLWLHSFRKASWWCVTSSSCAGPHTATCPTPRRPSSAFWLRFTTGRGSVEKDAPSSTVCKSAELKPESYLCVLIAYTAIGCCFQCVYVIFLLMNFILVWKSFETESRLCSNKMPDCIHIIHFGAVFLNWSWSLLTKKKNGFESF